MGTRGQTSAQNSRVGEVETQACNARSEPMIKCFMLTQHFNFQESQEERQNVNDRMRWENTSLQCRHVQIGIPQKLIARLPRKVCRGGFYK